MGGFDKQLHCQTLIIISPEEILVPAHFSLVNLLFEFLRFSLLASVQQLAFLLAVYPPCRAPPHLRSSVELRATALCIVLRKTNYKAV